MTLQRAIEIQTLMGTPGFICSTEDILAARKLAVEALNIIINARKGNYLSIQQPLPGETE